MTGCTELSGLVFIDPSPYTIVPLNNYNNNNNNKNSDNNNNLQQTCNISHSMPAPWQHIKTYYILMLNS